MANSKSNIYTIPLNGSLETNEYKGGIKAFQGFNEKNAFFRNNALTPFFKKTNSFQKSNSNVVADENGNIYYAKTENYTNWLFKKSINGEEKKLLELGNPIVKETIAENEDIIAICSKNIYLWRDVEHYDLYVHYENADYFVANSNHHDILRFGAIDKLTVNNKEYIAVFFYNKLYVFTKNPTVFEVINTKTLAGSERSEGFRLTHLDNYFMVFYNNGTSSSSYDYNNELYYINPADSGSSMSFDSDHKFLVGVDFVYSHKITFLKGIGGQTPTATFSISPDTRKPIYTLDIIYSPQRYTISSGKYYKTDRNIYLLTKITATVPSAGSYHLYNELYCCGKSFPDNQYRFDLSGESPVYDGGLKIGVGPYSLLINNQVLSGISVTSSNKLLTEWFSIDTDFQIYIDEYNNIIIYKGNDGKIYEIKPKNKFILSYYNGLVLTNGNYKYNAYDTKLDKNISIFSDFNNRTKFAETVFSLPETISRDFLSIKSVFTQKFMVSAENANYEVMKKYPSILLNPISVYFINPTFGVNLFTTNEEFVYLGSTGSNLEIQTSGRYEGLTYPIDTKGNILYSPNEFSKFISSFINQDMIICDNVGYPLIYSNQRLIFGYYLLSEIEHIEIMFNIQGQSYGIADNKIFSYSYNSGVISGISPIVNVTNYEFIGNTTQTAYFWNKINKSIYSFTGANILSLFSEAYEIDNIISSAFDVTTQTIFIVTDTSVYLLNDQLCEQKISGVEAIYSFEKGFVFLTSNTAHYYSYVKETGFEAERLEIETCFYGAGDNVVSINDTLYLRLYNANRTEGVVKINVTTITNEEETTEETSINIKSSDWDNKTNSVYLRYQPKKQRGLGSSFAISSPFAITYIGIGNTVETLLVDKLSKGAVNAPSVSNNDIDF